MKDEGVSLLLDAEAEWPMPGFAAKLVGIAAGEERQIDMSFADAYENESLRGRPAHFAVTASAVKSRTLPEWSDGLAKEIGDFETLLDLRVAVRRQLQQNTERSYEAEYAGFVKDIVTAGATVRFPPSLLEREIDNLADDLDRRLREQNLNLEDYLKIENRTRESLREELRPRATERLKWALILGKVVEAERLDLETGEVEQKIQSMSQFFGKEGDRVSKALSTTTGKRSIALDLLTEKAVERLVAIAKGEGPPLPEASQPAPPEEAEAMASETEPPAVESPESEAASDPEQPVALEAGVQTPANPGALPENEESATTAGA